MSSSNPTRATLFFLFIFFIASFKLSFCMRKDGVACPKIEKQSLLNFKQSLKDPYNQLSSWGGEVNCCEWKGVVCNNFTGHVHQLHLRGHNSRSLYPIVIHGLSGKINPSLLNLKQLRYLDLSRNNFTGETIPSFIGSFTNLEYLNLSYSGFRGKIPHNIGNLSNLHTLDLEGVRYYYDSYGKYHYHPPLEVDRLEWLSGLSRLEYLNMNGANLSKATNWPQVINSVPSLLELHFHRCSLDFMAPLNDVNFTSLTFLDLSFNDFQSFVVPRWIFQLSNLLFLDLSFSSFQGPIPTTSIATKLQHLDLSEIPLNSSVPDWFYFCKDLEFVGMRGCGLRGTISNAISNLTSLNFLDLSFNQLSGKIPRDVANLCKIQDLRLSDNDLQGEISDSFGNMSGCFLGSLEFLDLGGNQLSGLIPISIGKLSSLEVLSLEDNKFTGNLPESLGQLFNLALLGISGNKLEGVVTESHLANLTKLEELYASGNHLTLRVSPNWIHPIQFWTLELGSWNLGAGSQIPPWLEMQKNIIVLDLSNTGISGNVPSWIWEISWLNLSHNHLQGKIPYIHRQNYLYLSANQFGGSLPRIADTVKELDLSNNSFTGGISHFLCDTTYQTYELEVLHLGGNQLSGQLPDCWMKWPSLRILSFGNNNLSGSIPNSIRFLANLLSLNLKGNKLSGQIPSPMRNCTKLVLIELEDNNLDGNVPTWIGTSLVKLKFLILRSNKLSGKIPSEICHLNSLQIMDFSKNKFSGMIPRCVYNFTAMAAKRILDFHQYTSYSMPGLMEGVTVGTKGTELHYDTILSLVTNIDLSHNNLSGDIPKELTSLVELGSLNLSGNHLTGFIPDNIGDMKQMESLDLSRNSLSGQIPNSFTGMSYLNHLNLSYNKLTGRIPESTQLRGFDTSCFIGNNLCGPPLTNNCSHDADVVHGHEEDNEGNESEIEWFYVFLSLGYAVGFSAVCTILVLKKSWREVYFGSLEYMWNKLYVYVYIKWTRLRKQSSPSPNPSP